jgi:predicted phage terminase large subunit-like protein
VSWSTFRPLTDVRLESGAVELTRQPPSQTFAQFIAEVNPRIEFNLPTSLMVDALQAVFDGQLHWLMINIPPGIGKSEIVSRLFSAYCMTQRPLESVGITSYGAEIAEEFTESARAYAIDAGLQLSKSQATKRTWQSHCGGACWGRGFGGAVRGARYHVGIVDDPHKSPDELLSHKRRERVFRYWDQTWLNRGHRYSPFPVARVLVMQRLAEVDLCGHLLSRPDADKWTVLALDAERDIETPYPVGRAQLLPDPRQHGELLLPRALPADLLASEHETDAASAAAQYQQRPKPITGTVIDDRHLRIVQPSNVPFLLRTIIGCDLAISERQSADYTVGFPVALGVDGRYYVFAPYRDQAKGYITRERILSLARFRRAYQVSVESVAYQLSFVQDLQREAAGTGIAVVGCDADRDKVSRARGWSSLAEQGLIWLVDDGSGWIQTLLDEISNFPMRGHDDQVDALGIALQAHRELGAPAGAGFASPDS